MFKKMFALASVTALTGLVATVAASGCSSTTTVADTGDTGPVTTVEAGKKDATVPDGSDGTDAAPGTCPTTDTIDATTAAWKPPATMQGSCTDKEIDALVAYVDANPKVDYAALKKSVANAACAKCLFVVDGATWGPFVEKADGTFERNNFGGCVAVASGSEACGKSYSQLDDCLSVACQDCAQDQATITACNTAAAKGACKAAVGAFNTACPSADALTICDDLATKYTFEAASRALCVGLGDAGDK